MRAEILVGRERRRRWSADDKLQIVREAFAPEARVALVARRRDLSRSQIYQCRAALRDRYHRWLAVCWRDDGLKLNAEMVRLGWALAYRPGNDPFPPPEYELQEAEARRLASGCGVARSRRLGSGATARATVAFLPLRLSP